MLMPPVLSDDDVPEDEGRDNTASPPDAVAPSSFLAPALEERLHAFESYIIQKVRDETRQQHRPDGAATSANTSHETAHGHRATQLMHTMIAVEAAKSRCAALEQRQAGVEAKVNALVSDFVVTNQVTKREMTTFAAQFTRKWKDYRKAAAATTPAAGGLSDSALSSIVEEQKEAGLRMREFIQVMSLMRQEMEDDRQATQESQGQSFTLIERIIERVNVMDEDIAQLFDRVESSEAACTELRQIAHTQGERLAAVEATLRALQEDVAAGIDDQALLETIVKTASIHQKNHQSAVSQKLLAVTAHIEELTSTTADLQDRCDTLCRSGSPTAQGEETVGRVVGRAVNRTDALRLSQTHRQLLRSRYFDAWRAWQTGREQARRDQLVLKLFAKQKGQIEDLQKQLDALRAAAMAP